MLRCRTRFEKIGSVRDGADKDYPSIFDEDLSEYIASEIFDHIKYACKRMGNTIVVSFPEGKCEIEVRATDVVIIVKLKVGWCTLRWSFDGDITDSDLDEICQEVNGRLEQVEQELIYSHDKGNVTPDRRSEVMVKNLLLNRFEKSNLVRSIIDSFNGMRYSIEMSYSNSKYPDIYSVVYKIEVKGLKKVESYPDEMEGELVEELPVLSYHFELYNVDLKSVDFVSFLESDVEDLHFSHIIFGDVPVYKDSRGNRGLRGWYTKRF